jgi:tRNA-modifying protein YgfZ
MVDQDTTSDDVAALLAGRGFVDATAFRKLRVGGTAAVGWLHDLLTADIAGLAAGQACRSLLLAPTGHIRADVHVVRREDDLVLVQDVRQPHDVASMLAPYVLSSEVVLHDETIDLALFVLPDAAGAPSGLPAIAPSCLGAGVDVLLPASQAAAARATLLGAGFREATIAAADAWRTARGIASMGSDFDERSLPAEAGLDELIDTEKGCFLGQESVARVRNLGHPPRVLRHVHGDAALARGDRVGDDAGTVVGDVTSAVRLDDAWIAFVRVAWSAATARLTDEHGHPLRDVSSAG